MPLKGFCLYYALLGLMQTTTSVVVLILQNDAIMQQIRWTFPLLFDTVILSKYIQLCIKYR